jgi:hypothetical protein
MTLTTTTAEVELSELRPAAGEPPADAHDKSDIRR